MKSILKDEQGVVAIELAIILTVLVVPVALATAKFAPPAIEWVKSTSKKMEDNTVAQERTAELLEQLIRQQGGSTSPAPDRSEQDPMGCDPTPGSSDPC